MARRLTFTMTFHVDLDEVPGMFHEAQDFVDFAKQQFTHPIPHYHPTAEVGDIIVVGNKTLPELKFTKVVPIKYKRHEHGWLASINCQEGQASASGRTTAEAAKRLAGCFGPTELDCGYDVEVTK